MASSTAVAKPRLRNLGKRQWAMGLGFSLLCSCSFAVWFKKNVVEARKQHYKDWYANYDDEKTFEAMRKTGVFKGFEPS